jgi:hypothetical protein
VVAVGAALVMATAAQAATPIGPNQYFVGDVNGSSANATIQMGCFGPVTQGETGHPLAGQYVYVSQIFPPVTTNNVGFTGAAKEISVSIAATTSSGTGAVPVGVLTTYDTKLPIPITLTLPCYGNGTAVFAPIPASPTGRAATVTVRFVGQP